jgi:carboxymethylenebutenolidase
VAVVFYGLPPSEAGDPATIEIPLQCHYAREDDFFTPAAVAQMEQRLKDGKVPYQLYWYDAKHGFCNPNQPGNSGLGHYNPQAAHEAWERTVHFLESTLKK